MYGIQRVHVSVFIKHISFGKIMKTVFRCCFYFHFVYSFWGDISAKDNGFLNGLFLATILCQCVATLPMTIITNVLFIRQKNIVMQTHSIFVYSYKSLFWHKYCQCPLPAAHVLVCPDSCPWQQDIPEESLSYHFSRLWDKKKLNQLSQFLFLSLFSQREQFIWIKRES